MIRQAEEILKENMSFWMLFGVPFQLIAIQSIKVAQREAIQESADQVKTVNTTKNLYEQLCEVNKQSILNLLNEVK